MRNSLENSRVVIIGASSNLGRQLADTARSQGADVVAASPRDGSIDLTDERSVEDFAARVGAFDHLVSTAAVPANGPLADLDLPAIRRAFDAKVIGPLLLAKHLGGSARQSFTFFSGVAAWRPQPGRVVMATTNGALAFLVEALAVELAPLRVNAVSPGIVDSGAWDRLGEGKAAFLEATAARNPARRVGTPDDVVQAVLYAATNPYVTGTVLHVDGGGRLAP
ncbi:SDR family oxidoreductase [Actinosynnema sp. NPDC020468]|uniref:SDR family oxidoreductase n=1 Tax=Actinosynnema sp. NPDC020468 TaxID=3154488 RepID=UPI0034083DB3